MYCKKSHPILILLWNTLIVTVVFMLIDYLFYGLISPGPDPYSANLTEKLVYTILFALVFAHLYNKTSRIWRPNSDEAFFYKKKVVDQNDLCKFSFAKLLNGMAFSLLVTGVILLAMLLGNLLISNIYIYLLDGIRGVPEDSQDTAILAGKIIIAGAVMESHGKTEDDPDR